MHLRFAENPLRPLPAASRAPARASAAQAAVPEGRPGSARRAPGPTRPGRAPRPARAAPGSASGAAALRLRPLRARQVPGAENWDFVGQLKTRTSHLARKDPALSSPIRRRRPLLTAIFN